jgi:hypothetical protein
MKFCPPCRLIQMQFELSSVGRGLNGLCSASYRRPSRTAVTSATVNTAPMAAIHSTRRVWVVGSTRRGVDVDAVGHAGSRRAV